MIGPRLKDLGCWVSGGTPPTDRYDLWDGDIPWLSGKDFERDRLRQPTKFITAEAARHFSRVLPGNRSIVVLVRGMALVHGVPVAFQPCNAAINQDVRGLHVAKNLDARFIYYALLGARRELDLHIDRAAHGTARLRETVYAHRLAPVPDRLQQERVARFLDHECHQIETLIGYAGDRMLQLLDEYRYSLVHEAVSGSLDIAAISEAQMDERLHAVIEGESRQVRA